MKMLIFHTAAIMQYEIAALTHHPLFCCWWIASGWSRPSDELLELVESLMHCVCSCKNLGASLSALWLWFTFRINITWSSTLNTLKAAPQPIIHQLVNVMYTPIIVVNNIYSGKAVHALNLNHKVTLCSLYLASQDALEVMRVTQWVSESVSKR